MEANLIELAKGDFTGNVVRRMSSYIGESPDKTEQAIDDALPSVFAGMAEQSASPAGANRLYAMAKEGAQQDGGILGTLESGSKTEALGQQGRGLLQNLFGDRTPAVADQIANHAGVSRGAASKILALVSPIAVATLGKQILSRGLGVSGLTSLLSGQRAAFAGAPGSIPSGRETRWTEELPPSREAEHREWVATKTKTRVGWLPLALLGLLGLFGVMLLSRGRTPHAPPVAPTAREVVPATPTQPVPQPSLPAPQVDKIGATGEQFSRYLATPNVSLPKRFVFDGLNFATDSAALEGGAPTSLDAVAASLRAHPTAQIRIEGYTDNVGDAEANRTLSLQRAEATRDLLVQRGVSADRIAVAGYGSERALVTNETEAGRAQNRRTEIVLIKQ